jgi:hypothetical protein
VPGDPSTVIPLSVANSLQNFSANPEEKLAAEEKKLSFSNFSFLKEFGLKKNTIFVCVSEKITTFLGHFSRIREDKRMETKFCQN